MNFREQVYQQVQRIPAGRVATYGQIAALIGQPRSARQVGFALRALSLNERVVPWWRVVNKQGYLSINHGELGLDKDVQKQLLEDEGIKFSDYTISPLVAFLWHSGSELQPALQLD